MIINTPGQPTKSSFETIKTLNWFGYVKNKVRAEVLLESKQEIEEIEHAKSKGYKWSRSRLRSLINTVNRLTGKGNYKNCDVKYSDIQNHLARKENQIYPDKLISVEGVGKLSGKVWGRYASGLYTPSRILDDLTLIYPKSKLAYTAGPNNLFLILESNTLNHALEALKNTLIDVLRTKNDSEIHSDKYDSDGGSNVFIHPSSYINIIEKSFKGYEWYTPSVERFDNLFKLFMRLQDIIDEDARFFFGREVYFKSFKHLDAGEAACFYLSFAYISYKFLGEPKLLPSAISGTYVLDVIELYYEIKATSWFNQNEQNPSNIISIFIEVQSSPIYEVNSYTEKPPIIR